MARGEGGTRHRAQGIRAFEKLAGFCAGALLLFAPGLAAAQDAVEAQELVDKAQKTIEDFKADPDIPWFRDHVPNAEAVMVVPVLVKGGFIIGGSGGHGALLWRDRRLSSRSMPLVFKILVVIVLLVILFSLFSGMFYMLKDGGRSTRTVKALTVRISLSLVLFVILLIGYGSGFFGHPA